MANTKKRLIPAVLFGLLCATVTFNSRATRSAASVLAVGPNVAVNTRVGGANDAARDYQSPSVAINPTNPDNIVMGIRHDTPNFGCQAHYSQDAGRSWAKSFLPKPTDGTNPETRTCWAPAVAFSGANRVYLATQDRPAAGGNVGMLVYSSTDGGEHFGVPVKIPGSGSNGGAYQAGITVDNNPLSPHRGRVYVAWYGFDGIRQAMRVAHSSDLGVNWSLTTLNGRTESEVFPTPVVAPDGTLYVIYKDVNPLSCQGAYSLSSDVVSSCPIKIMRWRHETNGALSLDGNFVIGTGTYRDNSAAEAPGIAVAPNGQLWATWTSLSPPQTGGDIHPDRVCKTDTDVFAARSSDRGATWATVRLNDDSCMSGSDQRNPWISVAPNGRVDAIFYDTRNDPDFVLRDVYHASANSSASGAPVFSTNRRITDRSFDTGAMYQSKSGFQASNFDRNNGLASVDGLALAAWGDARNTGPLSPSGISNNTASDVFASRISTEAPVDPRPVSRVRGADPYATSAALSRETFSFAKTVTIASEKSFVEPLAAAPLARKSRGPLFLTPTAGLTEEVENEVMRLRPGKAYLVGGTDLVGTAVEAQLKAIDPNIVITRLAGANANATARRISQELGAPASRTAVIVSGGNFTEALTSGALAAFERIPVLPVMKDSIPPETKQALTDSGITKTLLIGGIGSISPEVFDQLKTDGRNPSRLAGSNPYETSVRVAEAAMAGSGSGLPVPANSTYMVTGSSPADALVAGPAVAYRGGLLLIADSDTPSAGFLAARTSQVDQVMLIGGCAGLSPVAGFAAPPAVSSCVSADATGDTTTTTAATTDTSTSNASSTTSTVASSGGDGGGTKTQSGSQGRVSEDGYWLVASDGGVFAFGDAVFRGSIGSRRLNKPIVGMAQTLSGNGYWLVASDGGVFAFGDAVFRGSMGAAKLRQPIVGMASTPSGNGYWLVASDGGVFAFGDAVFRGSTGSRRLNKPIVGMARTLSGNGYWLAATDGGVFAFGDAVFRGSMGAAKLRQPIVGMASTPSGNGYWLAASDGGVFAFGDAVFRGSTGSMRLNKPIIGMASNASGDGYRLAGSDGGIFAFGQAPFRGSTGGLKLNQPVVGIADRRVP